MSDANQNSKMFNYLEFSAKRESSSIAFITIIVAPILVNRIRKYTLEIYKSKLHTRGFSEGMASDFYVEKNCALGISESCTKFILKFFVLDFLEERIHLQKIVCLSAPKIVDFSYQENGSLIFNFRVSVVTNISPDAWEKINYNPPRRKLYKDLDRQASIFIKAAEDEVLKVVEKSKDLLIENSDWVKFSTTLLNNNNQPAIRSYKNDYWLKIDIKYLVTPLHKLFLGRKEGDVFVVEDLPEFGGDTDLLSIKGKFRIQVCSIVKADQFSLAKFKSNFYLKDIKDIHEKLIEIFSFRNDISQRRLMIDEAFRVLFSKIRFEVPRYLVLRKQEKLLAGIKKLPDYNVYKMNENFSKQVAILAEKQIKEDALVRQIGFNEDISVSHEDILNYLNLFNHPRLSEFIYFQPSIDFIQDICLPIKETSFRLTVLKEKVLNLIIKKLSER